MLEKNKMKKMSWQGRALIRLQNFADARLADWKNTPAGKAWKRRGGSPYNFGFCLPDYYHALIQALNENDEEKAKLLILDHFSEY